MSSNSKPLVIMAGLFTVVIIAAVSISCIEISSGGTFQFLNNQSSQYGCDRRYNWGPMSFTGKYLKLYSLAVDVNNFYAKAQDDLLAQGYKIVPKNPHMEYNDSLKGHNNYYSIEDDPFSHPMFNISKNCMLVEDSNLPSGQQIIRKVQDGYITIMVKYPQTKRNKLIAVIEHLVPGRRR